MAMLLCSMSAIAQTEEEHTQNPEMYSEEWEWVRDRVAEESKYTQSPITFTFMGEKGEKGKTDAYDYVRRGLGNNWNKMSPSQNVRCVKRRSSASSTAARQQRIRDARQANAKLTTQSWQRMRDAQAAAQQKKREDDERRRARYQKTYRDTYDILQPVADNAREVISAYAEISLQREQDALNRVGAAVESQIEGIVNIGDGNVITTYSQGSMDAIQAILDGAEDKIAALDGLDVLQEIGNYCGYSEEEPEIPEDIDQKYYLTIGGLPYVDENGCYATFSSEAEAQQELDNILLDWELGVINYNVTEGVAESVLTAGREHFSNVAKIVPPKETSASNMEIGEAVTPVEGLKKRGGTHNNDVTKEELEQVQKENQQLLKEIQEME